MDRIIYTAMNGAARIAEHHTALSNNMANVNTPGFREQVALYRSVPVIDDGSTLPTRVATVASTPGSNFDFGVIQSTGRDLDVAIAGSGWLAVQTGQGEAYTRAGNLHVGANGLLQTVQGLPVLSDQGGEIEVPERAALTIASDGTITALGAGDPPNNVLNLGRLKLVNPPKDFLDRSEDGFFRQKAGPAGQAMPPLAADPSMRVMSGMLEGSNVSAVSSMVGMIENSRRFEMQMQVIKHADTNAERSNSILSVNG